MLTDAGLKVYAVVNPAAGTMDLYVVNQGPDPNRRSIAKPIALEFEDAPWDGGECRPTLRLPYHTAEVFLRAMGEAATQAGHKPADQSKVEGVLEATRGHLEDLRALLKLSGGGTGPSRLDVSR